MPGSIMTALPVCGWPLRLFMPAQMYLLLDRPAHFLLMAVKHRIQALIPCLGPTVDRLDVAQDERNE